uniref:Uncharacterized protein n=1 Tax=Vespula pensylvanica TaxID=30213 RepID=A0A834PAL9_VESPE|nr:hypothetical protein H0235_002985 [Vespula pensylvanica]
MFGKHATSATLSTRRRSRTLPTLSKQNCAQHNSEKPLSAPPRKCLRVYCLQSYSFHSVKTSSNLRRFYGELQQQIRVDVCPSVSVIPGDFLICASIIKSTLKSS